MKIDVITIFPEMFAAVLGESIIKRAQERGVLRIDLHNLRDYTHDKHRSVDDRPYGGGPGMVMRPEPIFEAVEDITRHAPQPNNPSPPGKADLVGGQAQPTHPQCQTILMSPQGERLSTSLAQRLAEIQQLIVICGHYEGVDERVKTLVDHSISIGDYVLTGGELPAMVLIDCLARFIPGVIGHEQATAEESFADNVLEYPQYTRPAVFRGMEVPEVLRSGDHEHIARWRRIQAIARTLALRPDLIERQSVSGQPKG